MKHFIFYLFILLFSNCLFAQELTISVTNCSSASIAVHSLSGDKISFVDSVMATNPGIFKVGLRDKKYHKGFYRVIFAGDKSIDFLNANENIEIASDFNNILDSLKIINSESNKFYYQFTNLSRSLKFKSELLYLILARYPKDDDYYQTTKEKLSKLQNEYLGFIKKVNLEKPKSFIARYINSMQLGIAEMNLPTDFQMNYIKSYMLNKVDFEDTELIYSDLFSGKSIEYLTLYSNPRLSKEQLEKEFMIAVDSLLNRSKKNQIVYKHIVEHLIDGFKKFGFDMAVDYIVQNYVIKDDICLDEKTEKSIEKRISQSKKFAIGNSVPNFTLPDNQGNQINLESILATNTLLIFYTSRCPHCQVLLPQIGKIYNSQKQKNLEVIAISLDENKSDWLNFIEKNKLNWINLSDSKGWEGKTATDYCIYATPSMFLINKEKKIISKPQTLEELSTELPFPK